jgi:hypothetical protein
MNEQLDDTSFEPEITMAWGAGAEQIWIDLTEELKGERDELRRNLFARVPEMTIHLATIIAFGRYSGTVDQLDMQLARELARESAETCTKGCSNTPKIRRALPGCARRSSKWQRRMMAGSATVTSSGAASP